MARQENDVYESNYRAPHNKVEQCSVKLVQLPTLERGNKPRAKRIPNIRFSLHETELHEPFSKAEWKAIRMTEGSLNFRRTELVLNTSLNYMFCEQLGMVYNYCKVSFMS